MIFRVFVFFSLAATGLSLSLERGRRSNKRRSNSEKLKTAQNELKTVRNILKTFEKACCPICLEDFLVESQKPHPDMEHAGDPIVRLSCGHEFHSVCIKTWLKKSPTCPSCRTPVRFLQLRYFFLVELARGLVWKIFVVLAVSCILGLFAWYIAYIRAFSGYSHGISRFTFLLNVLHHCFNISVIVCALGFNIEWASALFLVLFVLLDLMSAC